MHVSCGIMCDQMGHILMGLRKENDYNPNYWEFPGGQQEVGETLEECLHREWMEELNLHITIDKCIHTSTFGDITCHFFIGKIVDIHKLRVNVHQYVGFYDKKDLHKLRLFEGDDIVVEKTNNMDYMSATEKKI